MKIPKIGYAGAGAGVVEEAVQSVKDFKMETAEGERPRLDVLQHASLYQQHAADPEKAEYFVKVDWLDTVPMQKAINEVGLFGNQNTVCQPLTPKWRHTVERLKTYFPKWDANAG